MAPVASLHFLSVFSASCDGPVRQYSEDPAVGTVELLAFRHDFEAGLDRLSVAVRWSGTLCEGDPTGAHRQVRSKAIRTHVYELVRKPGIVSQGTAAFSSASCSQCGAPVAVANEAVCPFCGAQLNDGTYDWTLDGVSTPSAQCTPEFGGTRRLAADRVAATPNVLPPAGPVPARVPPNCRWRCWPALWRPTARSIRATPGSRQSRRPPRADVRSIATGPEHRSGGRHRTSLAGRSARRIRVPPADGGDELGRRQCFSPGT